ncbi:MAG: aldehyde dehydrogenase family protein [Phycisphaeraceae bacterium]|nr:aldehyde dehydrogenase family protein [Phycisphaeraceae bacterium]
MAGIPHIPALRLGERYESLDQAAIKSVRSHETIAEVSQVNAGIVRRDILFRINASQEALRSFTCAELIGMTQEAGRHFMESELDLDGAGLTQTPEQYEQQLSATSGLPNTLIRRNMAKIHEVFVEMDTILRGLTRGLDLSVIDQGRGEQAGLPVSYFPTTRCLGVVLPSNSPGVNSLWMPAIPLKIPVVLKPGREEPWTPLRCIGAFVAAGVPREAFGFYPTDHEGSSTVLASSGRSLIFGGQETVERYAGDPSVEVHGPGWSKVLIGEDQVDRWPELIDLLATSIAANSGRSCINASAVLTPRHGRAIAEALAEKLAAIRPLPHDDPNAALSGFANPKMAEWMDRQIDQGLKTRGAEDLTAAVRKAPRKIEFEGSTYLHPTVIHCDSFDHPLANKEFMFPYASVTEVPQNKMLEVMGPSLVVSAVTKDPAFTAELMRSPLIQRLNLGDLPTSHVHWDQPHEGNLFEFLYHRRAIQVA